MLAPEFWRSRNALSLALTPAALVYEGLGRWRRSRAQPRRAAVPVICVGNLVAGGAGKTPAALALVERLIARRAQPHLLTRGYRGRLSGPVTVDPAAHGFRDVGDEALLLAAAAPTWVSKNRAAGADAATGAGARVIVMDDGLQNPDLVQTLTIIVIDGVYGIGNGRVLPAGPLREAAADGFARAHAVVLVGEDRAGVAAIVPADLPVICANLTFTGPADAWRGRRVVAFAGIGRPAKFFETLENLGAELVSCFAFADHHPYAEGEISSMLARAAESDAVAVTTAKDWVRLPDEVKPLVQMLPVRLTWSTAEDESAIEALLDRVAPRW